jgi:hypothetical protein
MAMCCHAAFESGRQFGPIDLAKGCDDLFLVGMCDCCFCCVVTGSGVPALHAYLCLATPEPKAAQMAKPGAVNSKQHGR